MQLFTEDEIDRVLFLSKQIREENRRSIATVDLVIQRSDAAIQELKEARKMIHQVEQMELFGT